MEITNDTIKQCAEFAHEKKAEDIISLDLQGISPITDYFMICTGNNSHQVKAICENIEEKMALMGYECTRIEGYQEAKWILMDYGSALIHIFQPEEREYYSLERLWGDAPALKYV